MEVLRVFTAGRNTGKLRGVMKSLSFTRPLPFIVLLISLVLLVAGCSGESGSGDQSATTGETDPPAETEPPAETTAAPAAEPTSEGLTTGEPASGEEEPPPPEETAGDAPAPPEPGGSEVSALSGVEAAERAASGWSADAQLYSITNAPTFPVTAEGRSEGWLYSFVSSSAGEIAMIEGTDEQAQVVNVAPQPEPLVQRISGNTLPPTDQLLDSTEAVERAPEYQSYLQENPGAGTSAGLDAASAQDPEAAGEPTWFLIVPETGLQERVDATAQ